MTTLRTNARAIFHFMMAISLTTFVFLRPIAEFLITPSFHQSTSDGDFQLPSDSAPTEDFDLKGRHDLAKPTLSSYHVTRPSGDLALNEGREGVRRGYLLDTKAGIPEVSQTDFKYYVFDSTLATAMGKQSGDQRSGDRQSGDLQADKRQDHSEPPGPPGELPKTAAGTPRALENYFEYYVRKGTVDGTQSAVIDNGLSGGKQSRDQRSSAIQPDTVLDHTQLPGKSGDIKVSKPKVMKPKGSHDVFKSNQIPRKVQSKLKITHKRNRTRSLVNWKRKKEPSNKIGASVVNDIFPSQSIPATNIIPTSERCYRQIHLWRNGSLGASGRVGDFFCPGLPRGLRLVADQNLETLKTSDAVILYYGSPFDWKEMHRFRPPGQRWIFYSMENPLNTHPRVIPPKDFYHTSYDYVMSYRSSESHLYASYGYFKPFINTSEGQLTKIQNWAAHKKRIVAWVASNCNLVSWDRTGFVRALSKFIPVSMYGKCGNKSCPKGKLCEGKLRKHKFYLALENSACRDYITEKVWKNAFHNNLVPVVYGAPKWDYERFLPPNSFIHVEDFPSVKALARYLLRVHRNDTLYNEYFEWRKLGSVEATTEKWLMEPEQICSNIVRKLLEDEKAMEEGTFQRSEFPDWKDWWTNSCLPVDLLSWPIKLK